MGTRRAAARLPAEEVVVDNLAARFPSDQFSVKLTRMIHRRRRGTLSSWSTSSSIFHEEGNRPAGRTWQVRGELTEVESGSRKTSDRSSRSQIERLSDDERSVLDAASVVGMECSSTAIAAALDSTSEWVEPICEALVNRHRFLTPARLVELAGRQVDTSLHVRTRALPRRAVPAPSADAACSDAPENRRGRAS